MLDVTDPTAARRAADVVREHLGGRRLGGLVNNAGIAQGAPLSHQSLEDFELHLKVNLTGVFIVTQAFLPLLGMDRALSGPTGRIVNVGSVSGRLGIPFTGAYSASKHGLEGISESLRRELMPFGVDVVVVVPGHVATPIWDKAEKRGVAAYADTPYGAMLGPFLEWRVEAGRKGEPPEKCAELIWTALTTRRPRIRYAPLSSKILGLIPGRALDRLFRRRIRLDLESTAKR
jgi:NAD(P)-dependent dehydrogenase (short-subunit alcohol dehydrogenase family)